MSVFNCCCDHGFQFVVVQGTPDTPWGGTGDDKLYLQSGQFSSTLKTSEAQAGAGPSYILDGMCWDGANTSWTDFGTNNQLVLQSGQYTSTVKTSLDADPFMTGGLTRPASITSDGNTPWCTSDPTSGFADRSILYLLSGQFTSTVLSSLAVDPSGVKVDWDAVGIATDGTDTIWYNHAGASGKFVLQSNQFDSTIKDSLSHNVNISDLEWDGTNILTSESPSLKLYSGKFSTTVKTSQNVSSIDSPHGVSSNALGSRSTP